MKDFIKCLCLYFFCLLPLATQAKPFDRVIFGHPRNGETELWTTDMWDSRNALQIFKHTHKIWEFAVQKDGPYVIFVAGHGGEVFEEDVYLIDRNQPDKKPHNLTQRQFEVVWDIDISIDGDIIFTNIPTGENLLPETGIYLIPNSEIKKQVPNIKRLTRIEARELALAPFGEQIAYSTNSGIFTLDIETQRIAQVSKFGWFPTFSPDGKKLAFVESQTVHVISLEFPPQNRKIITLKNRVVFGGIKWSPDGKYIVYRTTKKNYAAPVNGGAHVEIFTEFDRGVSFDWTNSIGYSVQPNVKLVTLWGKLKQ